MGGNNVGGVENARGSASGFVKQMRFSLLFP